MADIFTPPPDGSYLPNTPFDYPTGRGTTPAIAFDARTGGFITAALSVIFVLIFSLLWNLFCFIALLFPGSKSQRKFVALVTLWNSNDAFIAFKELASYTYRCYEKARPAERSAGDSQSPAAGPTPEAQGPKAPSRADFWHTLALTVMAFVIWGAGLALGIVGPDFVKLHNVAPVRASAIYYPAMSGADTPAELVKTFGIKAPSMMRALGSVEAADVTVRDRVHVKRTNLPLWNGTESNQQLDYDYRLTGIELGLQQGSGLELSVTGSCKTEYDWYSTKESDEQLDTYFLWNNSDVPVYVNMNKFVLDDPPKVRFVLHPDAPNQADKDGKVLFAIAALSAHRGSVSDEGSDPWYKTESIPKGYEESVTGVKFWVKNRRPVLSCWQQDQWSYKGRQFRSISKLQQSESIGISPVLLSVLAYSIGSPAIYQLGFGSGDSILKSRTTSPNGKIDASATKVEDEMERLVLASYVWSRNVFVDCTMYAKNRRGNFLLGPDNQPKEGAANFFVAAADIQTFSLIGLIVLAAVLATLLFTQAAITTMIRRHSPKKRAAEGSQNSPAAEGSQNSPKDGAEYDRWMRPKVLTAVQLFRRIYEPQELGEPREFEEWPCNRPFPESAGPDFDLAKCPLKNHWRCKGHIKTKSNGAQVTSAGSEAQTEDPAKESGLEVQQRPMSSRLPSADTGPVTPPESHPIVVAPQGS
ncbi:hypothetical protein RB595_003494 [Gaeumannomyces hyphopodioides]